MPWPIGVTLRWIGRALLSPSGEGPSSFDDGPVTPTADVIQGGVGVGVYSFHEFVETSAAVNTWEPWTTPDLTVARLIQLGINKTGAAAAANVRVQLAAPLNSAGRLRLYDNQALAGIVAWRDAANGSTWWIVPPGYKLQIRSGGLTAPDTLEYRLMALTIPAGAKGW